MHDVKVDMYTGMWMEDPRLESRIYKKDIKNKRVSENRWVQSIKMW